MAYILYRATSDDGSEIFRVDVDPDYVPSPAKLRAPSGTPARGWD